uniref:Delta(3,5)-Delta(2,4)-dienoyl-CoA isomerase, mitochondrial n=1 Tax=Triatoma infestans TaxID=30076 RepID=A0A023F9K5_TRIIF
MSSYSSYKTLNVTVPKPFIYHVELNRPEKLNAFNETMWKEIGECFTSLGDQDDCRVVLLSGNGRLFTAGIDFNSMISLGQTLSEHEDVARRCKILKNLIHKYQDSITSLEKCVKPVISLVHNACIGAGVDLITAADIRYCTEDAVFQVKEVGIGMAADVGTLQRLPRVVGSTSLINELAFTARKLLAPEAKECGLVNRVYKDKESMISEALQIAEDISKKSPVAVQSTKRSLIFSRDHSVQESLNHIADWNQTMLQSEDFMNASVAEATKSPAPVFAKL